MYNLVSGISAISQTTMVLDPSFIQDSDPEDMDSADHEKVDAMPVITGVGTAASKGYLLRQGCHGE